MDQTARLQTQTFSGKNGKLAFYGVGLNDPSDDEYGTDIFTVNPDGSDLKNLTQGVGNNFNPVWSPDGKKIAFIANRPGPDSPGPYNGALYTMNSDGTDQVNLTGEGWGVFHASWSPDGRKLVYSAIGNGGINGLYVMNADGTAKTRLAIPAASHSEARYMSPVWSSDAQRIAYVSVNPSAGPDGPADIYISSPDGLKSEKVASMAYGGLGGTSLSWSPDGQKLLISHGGIYTLQVTPGSQPQRIPMPVSAGHAVWSPDGNKLLVSVEVERSNHPGWFTGWFVTNADGSNPVHVPLYMGRPDWQALPLATRFNFTGFLPPVTNLPGLTTRQPGAALPVKFRLGGNQGLNILAAGYPRVISVPCHAPLAGGGAEASAESAAGLTYDAMSATYTYVWKTSKSAKGCDRFVLRLIDDSVHQFVVRYR
ncbi:PxKF domain-containing protein [Deinococcus malanensis]|nr:PxKF domain-containing protein [Deinococcus malanensis]